MKRTLLAVAILLLSIGNVAQAGSWHSRGNNTFDGHITFCATDGGFISSETLPDGTLIERFFNIGNLWVTGNPRIDGYEENEVTATYPPDLPEFTLDIRGTVDVDAVDGGWRFQQMVFIGPDYEYGIGFGMGTGDLRGQLIVFRSGAVELGIETPCGIPAGVPIRGRIIRFGWRT